MNITVTTIRRNCTQAHLAMFLDMYTTNERLAARIDREKLLRTGRSETKVMDVGQEIETIVELMR